MNKFIGAGVKGLNFVVAAAELLIFDREIYYFDPAT